MSLIAGYQLIFKCKTCRKQSILKKSAYSRSDLENQTGTNFYTQCTKCLKNDIYHVNDVKAESSSNNILLLALIAIIIGGIFTLFLFKAGFISTITLAIPVGIYLIYKSNVDKSINQFNKHYVSRTRNYKPGIK